MRIGVTLVVACTLSLTACDSSPPEAVGGPLAMRRLTEDQYRNAIEDAFGADIKVGGRFEPDRRRAGLNAVGTSLVSVTRSGFEQYDAMARDIAAQVVSPELRAQLPCTPADAKAPDTACATQVLRESGRILLRRPLPEADLDARVELANQAAQQSGDFYKGLQVALSSLLVAPDFIFRIADTKPAPTDNHPDRLLLTDYTLASRLSYFLWNRGPDEELLAAAGRGELSEPAGLERQVDRMLASEYLASGVRAFFEDLLQFDAFDNIAKDVARYPLYTRRVAEDAREQTLRFIVDTIVEEKRPYPALFTSRALPMTRSLGPIYGLPVRVADGWEDATVPAGQARAGLLSHASINMLHAHPGRSSPTLRGVFIREAFLCQSIPEAPADVDFTLFSSEEQQEHKTARQRLAAHATQPSCEGCHRLTDPIGLGLEVFDGIGRYRTTENGAPIDTRSDFDGRDFSDPVGLGQAVAESPLINACLVEHLYRYAVGREESNSERRLLRYLEAQFEDVDYRVPALMRAIAMSEGFRTATAEETGAVGTSSKSPPESGRVGSTAAGASAEEDI